MKGAVRMHPEQNPQPWQGYYPGNGQAVPSGLSQVSEPAQESWAQQVQYAEMAQESWAPQVPGAAPGQQWQFQQPQQPVAAQQWSAQPAPVQPVQEQWISQAPPVEQQWISQPAAPVQQQWGSQPAVPVQEQWISQAPPVEQQWISQPAAPVQQQWAAQPAAPVQEQWISQPQDAGQAGDGWVQGGQPPAWEAGPQPWMVKPDVVPPPVRRVRRGLSGKVVAVVAGAVVLLAGGAAAGTNAYAKNATCDLFLSETAETSGSAAPTAAQLEELQEAMTKLRGYTRFVLFDGDLRSSVRGFADDMDALVDGYRKLAPTKGKSVAPATMQRLGRLVISADTQARKAQAACGAKETGLGLDD